MAERADYTGEPGPTGPEGPPGTTTWAGITDKPTTFAPEAHKTSHQDAGADEIDCAGLAGRVNYVDRGDPTAPDWDHTTLTQNYNYTDLNCSAIVPAGAKAIHFSLIIRHTLAFKDAGLRKNGNTQTVNAGLVYTQVSNINISLDVIVPCDANRIIEYYFATPAWPLIILTIRGWFI